MGQRLRKQARMRDKRSSGSNSRSSSMRTRSNSKSNKRSSSMNSSMESARLQWEEIPVSRSNSRSRDTSRGSSGDSRVSETGNDDYTGDRDSSSDGESEI